MTLNVLSDQHLVRAFEPDERHLLLKLTAPKARRRRGEKAAARPAVNVCFVLDRSGSLAGVKIALARYAVERALQGLTSATGSPSWSTTIRSTSLSAARTPPRMPSTRPSSASRRLTPGARQTSIADGPRAPGRGAPPRPRRRGPLPPHDRWSGQRRRDRSARADRLRGRPARIRCAHVHLRRGRRLRRDAAPSHRRCRRRPLLLHLRTRTRSRTSSPASWGRCWRPWRGRGDRRQARPGARIEPLSPIVAKAAVPGRAEILVGDLVAGQDVELVLRVAFPRLQASA